ncbi:MAG: hypothetical protein LQ346_003459 [Caloplaca aetnensis]|nr:MAG: hypothetical protein LQ346_003459 [Caloplaca aetnensis]
MASLPKDRPVESQEYILSRGFTANVRQNLQYYLWKDNGFSLHPSISVEQEGLRVAEIGAATGIWLVDLARHLPASAHIDGFDIDISQCPPKDWLPANVSVHRLDCIAPIPAEFVEQYDMLHIQLFQLGIQDRDPEPVVQNLLRMLRPGGWISWGEYDYSRWEIVQTAGKPDNGSDDLTALLDYVGTIGGTRPNWARNLWPARLPQIFEANGLVNISEDRRPFPKELLQTQLDAALMACEEVSYGAMDHLGGGRGEKARELIAKCFRNRSHTAYNVDRLTVIGRKPLE